MPMKMTFRWYGEGNDRIKLSDIKQIPGVKGIVWALHDKMPGEIWSEEEIATGTLTAELDPDYTYYYVRVIQNDKDIAVTAPVWVGESLKLGISAVETTTATPVTGAEAPFTFIIRVFTSLIFPIVSSSPYTSTESGLTAISEYGIYCSL